MNYKENNKLIAEFMGCENIRKKGQHPMYKIPEHSYIEIDYGVETTIDIFNYLWDMEYHTSWEWFMPVVEKIGLMPYKETRGLEEYLESDAWRDNVHIYAKMNVMYKAVVEFIKWYNSNNSIT